MYFRPALVHTVAQRFNKDHALRDPPIRRRAGTGFLVTFIASNWLLSVVLAHQPHFLGQPENIQVFWGYGLFPDQPGNFVSKKMSECTGADLLVELCCHLRFNDLLPAILETTKCIPWMMPFITTQFMPRTKGDRPAVRPVGTTNLASIGQFCEIPDHVGFTVEYAVRSRKRQSMPMFGFDKEVSPIYKGTHDLGVLLGSALAMVH